MDEITQNSALNTPQEVHSVPQEQQPSAEVSPERSEAEKRKLLLTLMRRSP